MAGSLLGRNTIPPTRMRVLGRNALILMLSGRGRYEDAEGVQSELRPGDAILVQPDRPHAYGSLGGTEWGQVYVVFSGPQFDLLQQSQAYTAHQPLWHLEPVDFWERRLREILQPASTHGPEKALLTVGRFAQLLIEMAASEAAARTRPSDAWLEKSLNLLGEPDQGVWLTPQEVARKVGLSYEVFRKRFAEHTGTAPGKFQKQRRIDLACAFIYQGQDNFKELAEGLGFCDVYHFSKVFRRLTGSPPSDYRRSVRGG